MADKKTLNTRISLKYDTWANWAKTDVVGQGGNLVLKKGEIAFCEIPAQPNPAVISPDGQVVQNPPHVMFKVGDGTKTFAQLNWGSAKAADVHGWAKESVEEFNSRVSDLITAALNPNGDNAVTIKGYVTQADFNEFEATLTGTTLPGITGSIDSIDGRVQTIENAGYITLDDANTAAVMKIRALVGKDKEAGVEGSTATGVFAEIDSLQQTVSQHSTTINGLATKGEVNALKGSTDDTETSATIEGAKRYADKKIEDFTKAYIDPTDNNTIDTLEEIASWIVNDEAGAAKLVKDVANLQDNKLDANDFSEFVTSDFTPVKAAVESLDVDVLKGIDSDVISTWNNTATNFGEHDINNVRHITADERIKWNTVDNKANTSAVDALAARVKTIEDDYLKEVDEFIIDCGTSTVNIF